MSDTIAALEVQFAKSTTKVERLEKALESARSETADLATAIRVIRSLMGGVDSGQAASTATAPVAKRHDNIIQILAEGADKAMSPAQIHGFYESDFEEISLDTFRTTLWRMKGKAYMSAGRAWAVMSDNGGYWKEKHLSPSNESKGSMESGREAELEVPGRSDQHPFRKGEFVGSSPTPPSQIVADAPSSGWDDHDDDVPF